MDIQNPLNNPSPSPAQAPLPEPSGLKFGNPKKKSHKTGIIIGIVAAVLVAGLFAIIIIAINKSGATAISLKAQYDSGYAKGLLEQKTASDKEFIETLGMDTRVYKAISEFGSFELPLPKTWSFSTTPKPADGTFSGVADPGSVDTTIKAHSFYVDLKRSDYDKIILDYDTQAKKSGGKIVASDVIVSGIKGRRYKGIFDTKTNAKAEIVVIPLREKIIVFGTDNPDKYTGTFNGILAATILHP